MALTKLQKEIMASIAKNRSETSYVADELVLNMNWPRVSDDIDIFQDTDEEIGPVAERDMETLRSDGFLARSRACGMKLRFSPILLLTFS